MIKQFEFNHFQVNCYVLIDEATRQCAIIDPAPEATYEDEMLSQYLEQQHLTPTLVLLTHAHVDHIAGLQQVCLRYDLPVTMHRDGDYLLTQSTLWGGIMGFAVDGKQLEQLPRHHIEDGEVMMLGDTKIEARGVPGHCPGSLAYVVEREKAVFTGDALFHFSVGRTDLPGGDYQLLIDRIKSRLLSLPDDYSVLAGHGIASTIGKERKYNEYLI